MKRGITVLSFVFLVMLVSFSTAFWPFDEPREAPVDVGVTVGNEPPIINFMSSPGSIIPVGGGTVDVDFSFIVEDSNGASDIDTASGSGSYTGPGVRESGPVSISCSQAATCVNCNGNEVNMTCSGTMQFYHDGGNWDIAVSIQDNGLNTVSCGDPGSAACTAFTYGTVVQMSSNPASIGFGTVSLTGTDQEAQDDPLVLTNEGNLDLLVDVTGYDLPGVTTPAEVIPSERFSAGGDDTGSNECDVGVTATGFGTDGQTATNIFGVNVLYGSSGNTDNMFFCLWDSLSGDGLSNQDYSSTAVGGTPWEVTGHV